MVKPKLYNLTAMSSQEENIIYFSYSGGLMKKNIIEVRRASNNSLAYTGETVTARGEHKIPANSINVASLGTEYNIRIKVIENDDTESLWSDDKFAIFIRKPIFEFSNVEDEMEINQSFLDAELSYSQADGELLQEYSFYLYDSKRQLLTVSDVMYDTEDMHYVFNGFEDGVYFIQAKGSTVNDYKVDTGLVEIFVHYIEPEIYTSLLLTNNYSGGYISYETNIKSIDYNGDDVFSFENGRIVISSGKVLYYDEGFQIPDNVTCRVKGIDMYKSNVKFFEVYDAEKKHGFYVTSYIYDDATIRYKLVGMGTMSNYVLYSPALDTRNKTVTFWIRRQNGIYLFKVYVE